MAKLIGTAGHVDHGKTTLIRALTGIDADRLPEEKQRGMTIDIGFAYIDLPKHGRVSIVDVPGHERFLTNMLVGALGIDVALLCVAADESVMPQTREHLQILEVLPVEQLVVALTRADLADEETQSFARAEIEELVGSTRFASAPICPVSAVSGQGISELRTALETALDKSEAKVEGPWYLPIDRAFSVKGHGCVVTGTLAQGEVKVGDRAFVEPGRTEVRVRAIHVHGNAQDSSERGKRTALNLSGIKVEDVHRGQALGAAGVLFETTCLDARMKWLTTPKHGQRIRLSIGAEEAIGKLFLSREDIEVAQFRLDAPVACALDQPLILRRYSPPDLLGGGKVVVPQSRPRRRADKVVVVQIGDEKEAILNAVGESANGMPTEEICRLLGKSPQSLGSAFEQLRQEGSLRGFAGLWISNDAFRTGVSSFLQALGQLHEQNPTQAWVPRERVASSANLTWAGKPLDRIVQALAQDGEIVAQGTGVRLPGFSIQLTPRQRSFLDRTKAELEKEPVNTASLADLARFVPAPIQAVEEIMKLGLQAGELVTVGDGIYYTLKQFQELKEQIRSFAGGKPFPASAVRDHLGTTRKYVIPLLEYLDSIGFTMRLGDQRVIK